MHRLQNLRANGNSSIPKYSCAAVVTMDGIRGDYASPASPGDAERSRAEEQDPGLTVMGKAREFFQICDLEGKGFVTRQDMQVNQNRLCKRHKAPNDRKQLRLINLELKIVTLSW